MQKRDKDCLLILMADGRIEDHDKVKVAARLCSINHVFSSVYNGAQLMDALLGKGAYKSTIKPDLLIMDIKLELIDGFEALNQISENRELKKIPIYILTKNKTKEDTQKAMKLGVRDYFQKPLKDTDLLEIVQGICKTSFL